MNISNLQGTDKQGSLLAASKISDDNTTCKSRMSANTSQVDAVIVSSGEKDTKLDGYKELLDKAEETTKEAKQEKEDASLEDASNTMTKEDYEDLKEEGISFESYEAGQLSRALVRIKENKEVRQENVEECVVNKEEMEDTIKKIAIGNKTSDPIVKKFAQKLVDMNMPVTQDNIQSLVNAMGMTGAITNLTEGAKAYLIDNALDPTIQNIYHSQYSGSVEILANNANESLEENGFEAIENQVEGIIKGVGINVTKASMDQAKWLFENNLPITKESLNALWSLNDVQENASEDVILDKMVRAMGKGLKPEEANLDESAEKKVNQAIKKFASLAENLDENTEIDSITAKRQLEEIRLKLTTEAGLKLLSKGITLDTTDLQSIVDGLKEMEKDYYKGLFMETSESATNEEISLLQNTTQTVNELKMAPSYILGTTLNQQKVQTLETLQDASKSMKIQLDKAKETYDTLKTTPRMDMGDSLQKAFQNVPDILRELGMEDSTANKRAVRILSYNQMDISEASITEVKAYDSKINNLLNELKPAVTVELIKKDINPLNVSVEELTKEVSSIRNEIGVSDEEKYSEYLWKLEKNNAISEEEKSSYIGIYRLFNNIEKSDGAAIGAVINNGMDLTLKNLLSAVRSKKVSGLDVAVDDSFGTLSDLSFSKQRISDQIETSFSDSNASKQTNVPKNEAGTKQNEGIEQTQVDYYQEVIARIIDEVSPEKLNAILKEGVNGLMDMTLEKIADTFEQAIEDNQVNKEYAAYITQKLQEIAKTSDEAVRILENHGIEPTIKNIIATNTFYTKGKSFFKDFNKNADNEYTDMIADFPDALEDAKTVQDKYDQVEAKVKNIIEEEYKNQVEDESSSRVDALRIFSTGIELAKRLSRQESYQIPITTGELVTTMNLVLLKGTLDSGKITLSMDSEEYGKLEGEFSVRGTMIKGFILCDSRDGLETMQTAKTQMNKGFENLGLEVKQLTFGYDKKAVEAAKSQGTQKEETSTNLLYQVAKVAVKAIAGTLKYENREDTGDKS
ncbi:MAG: DUF6240 domain-containing protein [Velocimicrobium sp.]